MKAKPRKYYLIHVRDAGHQTGFTKYPVLGIVDVEIARATQIAMEVFNTPAEDLLIGELKRPKGWKDHVNRNSFFWVKFTRFGQRYLCKFCGKDTLGIGGNNHWKDCPCLATA